MEEYTYTVTITDGFGKSTIIYNALLKLLKKCFNCTVEYDTPF